MCLFVVVHEVYIDSVVKRIECIHNHVQWDARMDVFRPRV